MMELSVLDEIIDGDFSESLSWLSPNAKPALSEMCRLEKELTANFDEARKEKLERVLTLHRQSFKAEQADRFKVGVRFGLLLCFEVFGMSADTEEG